MNNEKILDVNTNIEDAVEVCTLPEENGGKFVKLLLGTVGISAAAGATIAIVRLVRKHKAKKPNKTKEEKMIQKLQKEGYTVVPPLDEVAVEIEEVVVDEQHD